MLARSNRSRDYHGVTNTGGVDKIMHGQGPGSHHCRHCYKGGLSLRIVACVAKIFPLTFNHLYDQCTCSLFGVSGALMML